MNVVNKEQKTAWVRETDEAISKLQDAHYDAVTELNVDGWQVTPKLKRAWERMKELDGRLKEQYRKHPATQKPEVRQPGFQR